MTDALKSNTETMSSTPTWDKGPLLDVTDLKTWFPVRKGVFAGIHDWVKAVDGVSFSVGRGRTLGLVGESGSGKTTVGRTILRLVPAREGHVRFDGRDVLAMGSADLRDLRRRMQIVFQDPYGSLNPRMTVGQIITEPLAVHKLAGRSERRDKAAELLERVGLSGDYVNRYPHEFSGGQRQRIGIARALSIRPDFIVCDEPVSALDVSIQAQVLNLLKDIQDEMGISYLFIAHNLAVVEHFADEVAVMYLGRIVEQAGRDEIYANPRHPYTKSLMSAAPRSHPNEPRPRIRLSGEVPSPISPPSGCPFHPRCPLSEKLASEAAESDTVAIADEQGDRRVMAACTRQQPALLSRDGQTSHLCACLYADRS